MRNEFPHIRITAMVTALPKGGGSAIGARFRAPEAQTASDLGFAAAIHILSQTGISRAGIGVILFASKTPDYRSPATACVLHGRLGLSRHCAAFDLNSGSVGWLHALQTAASLMEAAGLAAGLVIAGDTTVRQFLCEDPTARSYGDGAVAILLQLATPDYAMPLVVECGGDGRGAPQFLFEQGGFRYPGNLQDFAAAHPLKALSWGHLKVDEFRFSCSARERMPEFIRRFADPFPGGLACFDKILIQQMGEVFLNDIRSKLNLTKDQAPSHTNIPDLCSASIPALLADQWPRLRLEPASRILAGSFGEGLSWGCAAMVLENSALIEVIHSGEVFADGTVSHER